MDLSDDEEDLALLLVLDQDIVDMATATYMDMMDMDTVIPMVIMEAMDDTTLIILDIVDMVDTTDIDTQDQLHVEAQDTPVQDKNLSRKKREEK